MCVGFERYGLLACAALRQLMGWRRYGLRWAVGASTSQGQPFRWELCRRSPANTQKLFAPACREVYFICLGSAKASPKCTSNTPAYLQIYISTISQHFHSLLWIQSSTERTWRHFTSFHHLFPLKFHLPWLPILFFAVLMEQTQTQFST